MSKRKKPDERKYESNLSDHWLRPGESLEPLETRSFFMSRVLTMRPSVIDSLFNFAWEPFSALAGIQFVVEGRLPIHKSIADLPIPVRPFLTIERATMEDRKAFFKLLGANLTQNVFRHYRVKPEDHLDESALDGSLPDEVNDPLATFVNSFTGSSLKPVRKQYIRSRLERDWITVKEDVTLDALKTWMELVLALSYWARCWNLNALWCIAFGYEVLLKHWKKTVGNQFSFLSRSVTGTPTSKMEQERQKKDGKAGMRLFRVYLRRELNPLVWLPLIYVVGT